MSSHQNDQQTGSGFPWGFVIMALAVAWFVWPSPTKGGPKERPKRTAKARAAASVGVASTGFGSSVVAEAPAVAVARVDPESLFRIGWGEHGKGRTGRNDAVTSIAGARRIPIEGFESIKQWGSGGATGRAVIIIPTSARLYQPVTVLVHLHGYNEGYQDRADGVRDLEYDRIARQLEAAGRQVIAVLPQGTRKSGFAATRRPGPNSGFDVDRFVDEVGEALRAIRIVRRPPSIAGLIISGHSGGGNSLIGDLSRGHGLSPSRYSLKGVILFDAINGDKRMHALSGWLRARIESQARDIRRLKSRAARARHLSTQVPAIYLAYGARGAYAKRYGAVADQLQNDLEELTGKRRLRRFSRERLRARYRVDAVPKRSHSFIVGDGERGHDGRRRYTPGSGTLERALSHILL
jgi:hypothetical protein